MKKVWAAMIKVVLAYHVAKMWYYVNRFVLKHNKSFNKTVRDFTWNMCTRWFKRFYALYDKLETIEQEIRG